MENKNQHLLSDDELEGVSGGYAAGDVVNISPPLVEYCPKCGKLLANLPVTITGVRGVLGNQTVYWVTYSCCGHKAARIEADFL